VETLRREEVVFNKPRGRMVFYFIENEVTVDNCSISRIVAIRNCCFLLNYFKEVR
jgi:hypothetical protein